MRSLTLFFCLIATLATALPQQYQLDTARSQVGFSYDFEGAMKSGSMPVKFADMVIDLDNVSASRVSVTLDARGARAGFFFATQAVKSPEILNTSRFPEIYFKSTRISGTLSDATVNGELTVRGITQPVDLKAGLYRQRGTELGERDHLTVLLTGSISRAAFGADGYSGFVGDRIGLRILARIDK